MRISHTESEFTRHKQGVSKPILMEKEVRAFLSAVLGENTKKTYTVGLQAFEEFMGKEISEIIEQRREDFKSDDIAVKRKLERRVEQFYTWLIKKRGLKESSAYAYLAAVKSIMSFFDINLKLRTRKPRYHSNDFVPSVEQLREIYECGDLLEKTLISLATNIPMRINDFNEIRKSDILPLLDAKDFPVWFEFETRKSKTPMPCFITEDTMTLLRKYIKTLRDDNEYLFQGRGKQKLNEDSINRIIKNLAEKADIDTLGKNVRFHMFRKVFISAARNMIGLSDDQIKMLTGKAVKQDMDPYYVNVKLRPWFIKVSDELNLTRRSTTNHEKLGQLEEAIAQLQRESRNWKTVAETLDKRNERLEHDFEELTKKFEDLKEFLVKDMDLPNVIKRYYRYETVIEAIKDEYPEVAEMLKELSKDE